MSRVVLQHTATAQPSEECRFTKTVSSKFLSACVACSFTRVSATFLLSRASTPSQMCVLVEQCFHQLGLALRAQCLVWAPRSAHLGRSSPHSTQSLELHVPSHQEPLKQLHSSHAQLALELCVRPQRMRKLHRKKKESQCAGLQQCSDPSLQRLSAHDRFGYPLVWQAKAPSLEVQMPPQWGYWDNADSPRQCRLSCFVW